jgi:hypothetical protein
LESLSVYRRVRGYAKLSEAFSGANVECWGRRKASMARCKRNSR